MGTKKKLMLRVFNTIKCLYDIAHVTVWYSDAEAEFLITLTNN